MSRPPVDQDVRFMRRALELAARGWGRVSPNPMVGCVVVADGEVIGEGYHAEFGGPHAERVALEAAGARAAGATCYVTLEPCAHTGKQPPCVDALIAAKVGRVVYAIPDPNPTASGGAKALSASGVEVVRGVCAADAAALNAPFLWNSRRPERPFVAAKLAQSLDGFIADGKGTSRWVSGPEARSWVQQLRAGFDAIAVGRRTALQDDPSLTVREFDPRVPPRRVVIGRGLPDMSQPKMFNDSGPATLALVISGGESNDPRVINAGSLEDGLRQLREMGIGSLLVEGGGELVGSLVEGDLLDRLYLITAPLLLGDGVPAIAGLTARPLDSAERWTAVERRTLGSDNLLVVDRTQCLPE